MKKSKNFNLNRAKKLKNDEYYTFYQDVEKIFNNLNIDLKDKIIDLPFDGQKSNFLKYCKDNKINYNIDNKFDYKNFNYSKNGIVISNPPFSIYREILRFFMLKNIKFVLIFPLNFVTVKEFIYYFNEKKLFLNREPIKKFFNNESNNLEVPCYLFSNFEEAFKKVKYFEPKIKEEKSEILNEDQLSLFEKPKYMINSYIQEIKNNNNNNLFTIDYIFHSQAKNFKVKVVSPKFKRFIFY